MAPTTPAWTGHADLPLRPRRQDRSGYPIRVCEMLVHARRRRRISPASAVNSVKNVRNAKKAIKKAFENQIEGKGFSLVEVLSTCPTNWGLDARRRRSSGSTRR